MPINLKVILADLEEGIVSILKLPTKPALTIEKIMEARRLMEKRPYEGSDVVALLLSPPTDFGKQCPSRKKRLAGKCIYHK